MSFWVGLGLLACGLALRWWGFKHLRQAGIYNLAGLSVPNYYTSSGPYRWMRHPLYWGSMIGFAGVGMMAFGWTGFVLALPAMPYFVERAILESGVRRAASEQAQNFNTKTEPPSAVSQAYQQAKNSCALLFEKDQSSTGDKL